MPSKPLIPAQPPKEPSKKVLAEDQAMKPLAKEFLKLYPDKENQEFPVTGARLTQNGWFLIECKEFVMLLPGKVAQGMNLFDSIFPGISGKKVKQILIIPVKKEKFGAYLALEDTIKETYHWDAEAYVLSVGEKKPSIDSKPPLSLEDFF